MTYENAVRVAPERAGPREWIGLAVLALPLLVLALDVSVLYVAAPELAASLRPSGTGLLWIMDIYGFLIAGFLITMGTLGDRIGRRRILMIGAVAFTAASLLAAFSISAPMLIVARALLGIAGATLMPSTLALINSMFRDPRQRGVAIATWMTTFSAGVAVGPIIGGALLSAFWWGSVFLLGVPVMVLLVVLAPIVLPEYRDASAGRLDLVSVALSLAAILPLVFGLKEFAAVGAHWQPAVALAVGVVFSVVFVRRQLRLERPLLNVRLFRHRGLGVSLLLLLVGITATNGVMYLAPQFLQLVAGLSPAKAGMWMIPLALAGVAGSMLSPFVARRVRPAYVIAGGSMLAVVGFLLITQVSSVSGSPLMIAGSAIAAFGLSPILVMSTDLVVGSAPAEQAGSAAAMSETSGELGTGLGVALAGSIATAVYQGEIFSALPSALPAVVVEASRETLAGALTAARDLPDGVREAVVHGARDAFTSGFNMVGVVGAVMLAVLAVSAIVLLRHLRPTGG